MKKTRLFIILLVVTLLCSIIILALCGIGGGNTPKTTPIKLTAPTVVLIDDTATWDAEILADKFEISVDGNLSYIENTVTSKKLTEGQTFKIRAIGDGKNYSNSVWSNSVTYVKTTLTYTIIWKNGNSILEIDDNVEYGTTPVYNGAEPQRAADAEYVYVFSGWSPEVREVTGNITYEAQFTTVPNNYTIVWKNGDTVLETDDNVPYGSTPSYDGATPTKDATVQYIYTFCGWTPQVSSVTKSVTYQAQFAEILRSYTVTFYSEDGLTVLDTVSVEYGSYAVYSRSTPVKNPTEGNTYVFEKWVTAPGGSESDDLTNITGNREVYAHFIEFVRTVTVYFVPNITEYGSVSVPMMDNVPYGAAITVNGNTVFVNGQSVTAIANDATAQYTYTFTNWDVDTSVGNGTTITANFSRSVNSYTVTWKNGDKILEIDQNVAYGTTPVYNGETPIKEFDDENIYTFCGWSPAISNVTGDVTYVAQFTTTVNKHIVIFFDDDGMMELGRVIVEHGENAIYPNALPTKESTTEFSYSFEKWVTEKNGITEANLTSITEDQSFYAKYTETVRTYTVIFCNWDGIVLSQLDVAYGNPATAPGNPERQGFRFDGWDKDFSNITEDLIVKATYVQHFLVEFLDYDHSLIDCQFVDYNGNATAPENPTRYSYRFIGWNTGFTNVVSDLTIIAEYVEQYKVVFLDYNGTVLKEQFVDEFASAIAPFATTEERNAFVGSELEGFIFIGWDKVFTNVSSNLEITASYRLKTYTVEFVMPDGTTIGEVQTVEHGFFAIPPEYPEFYLEGTGDYTKVFGFTRWNKSFDHVKENLVVEAVYESDYTKPVIIIEYSQEPTGDANLYIYNHKSMYINAIEFKINYNTDVGNIFINSAIINSASPFWVEDSNANNDNQYVINNNEHIFTFAWSDANGKQFDYCSRVITFKFSTDGAVVSKMTFNIECCSAIVSDSNGNIIDNITPVIVYR